MIVSVIYGYVTKSPKLSVLKQQYLVQNSAFSKTVEQFMYAPLSIS